MFRTYQPKKRQRKKRARLPQENGHRKRPQGAVPPQSEGQKKAELLSRPPVSRTVI